LKLIDLGLAFAGNGQCVWFEFASFNYITCSFLNAHLTT